MTSLVQANVTFQGSITSLGTFGQTTYAPVDLGVNSLSLKTGNLTSLITTTSSAPTGFAAAGEGALVFPGTANAFISFGTYGQPFSNSNIYSFGDFVVEAWVNPTSITNSPIVVGYGDPSTGGQNYWQIGLISTGSIQWISYLNGVASDARTTAGIVQTGTWQHMAIIHQSATRRIQVYLNGQPQTFTAGSNGGFTMTGTVISYTTGIIPVAGQQLSVGQLFTSPLVFNGSLTNLRVTTGSGAAQIYNNNAFTPSTTPLFPASNTAGGSLTTRLLVRVPLAPGKMVVPKLGGANCNTVLAFPPAPMTTYATNMTGQSYYGGGVYVASASTEYTPAWYAFDKSSATQWGGSYSYTTNVPYGGTVRTVDVNGTSYAGEWLQIQKPSSIVLSSYSILPQSGPSNTLSAWYVLGSRDGTNWFLIDRRSGATWTSGAYNTYQVQASQAFSYFRIVINIVSNGTGIGLPEWTLNGTIEGPSVSADGRLGVGVTTPTQALEVAGSAVVAGTLSAGNPLMFRNRIINGDVRVDQRGSASSAITNTAAAYNYAADRFWVLGRLAGKISCQQSSVVPTGMGFVNSFLITSLSAYTTVTSDFYGAGQYIEGYNIADLMWGTSYGVPATLSFWVRSSVTGSFTFNVVGGNGNQPSYSVQYTISNANTWQQIVIVIPPPPSGYTVNFPSTNTAGCRLWWDLGSSDTSYATSAPGTWVAGDKVRVSGSVNFVATNGATLYIAGVQLEKGTVATPFEFRPYAQELALCQRYLFQLSPQDTAPCYQRNSVLGLYTIRFPVTMRTGVNPTISGGFNVSLGATDTTQTSLTTPGGAYQPSATGSQYNFPSAQTIGLAGHISINASGYIRYDAEL